MPKTFGSCQQRPGSLRDLLIEGILDKDLEESAKLFPVLLLLIEPAQSNRRQRVTGLQFVRKEVALRRSQQRTRAICLGMAHLLSLLESMKACEGQTLEDQATEASAGPEYEEGQLTVELLPARSA